MPLPSRIALIGDYSEAVPAHRAIPKALTLASAERQVHVEVIWLPTDTIGGSAELEQWDGFWCVPASPYRSMEGALTAIRFARESGRPFLGSCGGFQHAVIEYARNVLGWVEAEHGETAPNAGCQVIAPLSCGLMTGGGRVHFVPESRLGRAYQSPTAVEEYFCRYGLNPAFVAQLTSGPLRVTATDDDGEVRAVELDGHRFFVATLFQSERSILRGVMPPIVPSFVDAVVAGRTARRPVGVGGA